MYKKFACFVFSGCLIFFLSFISLADDFETSEISKTEYGGTGLGKDDFLGSQDNVGDSYVDNEGIQNFVETSPDSMEFTEESLEEFLEESSVNSVKDFSESSQADVLENGGLLDENGSMVPESEENTEAFLENEKTVLESEAALLDNPEDNPESKETSADSQENVLESRENLVDSSELEFLLQSYMDSQDSPEGFSNMGTEDISSSELYIAVSECRDFLESCMYLLSVDTALLSILIGCLCCSIFSKFLRWWR